MTQHGDPNHSSPPLEFRRGIIPRQRTIGLIGQRRIDNMAAIAPASWLSLNSVGRLLCSPVFGVTRQRRAA
jgi:hypothetical protein